jgi:hypothetical protein
VSDRASDFWVNYFGESTSPFEILVTEQHFRWLGVQCEEMGITKEELIFNALREWTDRTNRKKAPNVDFSWLVFVALEDFIRRHHSEFLPVV